MDGEQTKYLCIREVLPISGVAEVCIGSRVVFLSKGVVCTPKCGQTQNKYHGCTSQHYGAGHQGYSWGIRGSDTQLWRQGGFFLVQNYTKKKKRSLIKNKTGKQTNPANTQEKKILYSFHWPNISCYSKNGDCKEVPLLQYYLNQIALNNLTPTFPPLASGYLCSLL